MRRAVKTNVKDDVSIGQELIMHAVDEIPERDMFRPKSLYFATSLVFNASDGVVFLRRSP